MFRTEYQLLHCLQFALNLGILISTFNSGTRSLLCFEALQYVQIHERHSSSVFLVWSLISSRENHGNVEWKNALPLQSNILFFLQIVICALCHLTLHVLYKFGNLMGLRAWHGITNSLKGLLYSFSNLYFWSQTKVDQTCMISYPKNSLDVQKTACLVLCFQPHI